MGHVRVGAGHGHEMSDVRLCDSRGIGVSWGPSKYCMLILYFACHPCRVCGHGDGREACSVDVGMQLHHLHGIKSPETSMHQQPHFAYIHGLCTALSSLYKQPSCHLFLLGCPTLGVPTLEYFLFLTTMNNIK